MNVTDLNKYKQTKQRIKYVNTVGKDLYIVQLESCIGDLLAVGKAKGWFWKNIWNKRVENALSLLEGKFYEDC